MGLWWLLPMGPGDEESGVQPLLLSRVVVAECSLQNL